MRRRILAATAALTLGLLALGAAPASAKPRPLPTGDALYALSCSYYSSETAQRPPLQLMRVDTLTAEAAHRHGYAVARGGRLRGPGRLKPGDLDGLCDRLGLLERAGPGGAPRQCQPRHRCLDGRRQPHRRWHPHRRALDRHLAEGAAYALGDSSLWTFDLATGVATEIGPSYDFFGLAFDPTSGVLYALHSDGSLYTVSLTDGSYTYVGSLPVGEIYSFAIDSSGILWFGIDYAFAVGYGMDLFSFDRADLTVSEYSGALHVDLTEPCSMSLLLTYPVKLAATGSSMDATALVAGGVLLVAGLALVGARRTNRA